jgi:protein-tyrosine phosphatase
MESAAASPRDRVIRFDGATNFRDLGGYATVDGGVTRWGCLYRSDSLHRFSAGDLEVLDALGVGTVYDLRRDDERDRDPGPRQCVPMVVPSQRVADAGALATREDGERWLLADYLRMLARGGDVFATLLTRLADADHGPAVFHCYSGKDRTGMVAVLLLLALGVDRETVLDDYDLTNRHRGVEHVQHVVDLFVAEGTVRAVAEGMLSAPRWAMAEALDHLDDVHGGALSYLGQHGAGPDVVARLRHRLVDVAGSMP